MSNTSNNNEISNTSTQAVVEAYTKNLIPEALNKLHNGLEIASKTKDIVDVFNTICSYAGIQTGKDKAMQKGLSDGIQLSAAPIVAALGAMAKGFGIEKDVDIKDITPIRDNGDIKGELNDQQRRVFGDYEESGQNRQDREIRENGEIQQNEINPFIVG